MIFAFVESALAWNFSPAGVFPSRMETSFLMEFSFPGWGLLSCRNFPFQIGDFFPVGKCEEGRHSELRSPFPLLALLPSGHAAVLRCGWLIFIGLVLCAAVLAAGRLSRFFYKSVISSSGGRSFLKNRYSSIEFIKATSPNPKKNQQQA